MANIKISELDSTTAWTNSDYLVIDDGSSTEKIKIADILKAYALVSHAHGSITNGGAITTDATIGSSDKIIIRDSDDSNKLKSSSITFNITESDTQPRTYLTRAGTFQTPGMRLLWTNSGATYSSGTPVAAAKGNLYNMVWVEGYQSKESAGEKRCYLLLAKGVTGQLTSGLSGYRTVTYASSGAISVSAASTGSSSLYVPYRIWGIC